MKLKVNNNTVKENSSMEEKNEVVGLKVKDVRQTKEEPEVFPEEEFTPSEELVEEDINEFVEPEDIPTQEDQVINPIPDIVDPESVKDGFKKIACARLFNFDRTTVFRFDIFYKEYAKDSGTIEYRNIVDNFNSVRPTKPNELKEFFAMFGIIRWNFPTTVLPVNTNVLEALLKIECLINEQIIKAGIKKGRYEFRVETVDED